MRTSTGDDGSPSSSDERLGTWMRAAQAGDAAAYRELLEAITPRIRRIVARQRGFAGPEQVEDLVQDVLLSVHKVRATYDPGRPFVPWLLAIVHNRVVDGARRYGRTAAREVAFDPADLTFTEPATNFDQDVSGDLQALRQAVQGLPARQRTAVELLKLQELSLKEASVISGMKVGALKVATHRAMAALRKVFGRGPERS